MRFLLFWVALLAIALTSAAQPQFAYVTHSNPALGASNVIPFGVFQPASGRYVEILDAAFLPAVPVKITEVSFTRAGTSIGPTYTAKQFQMRMSHTTVFCPQSMRFADWCGPCPTELISTTSGFSYTPAVDTWTPVGTVCDFGYDGRSNICLEIRYRNAGRPTLLGFHTGDNVTTKAIPRLYAQTYADNYVAPQADPNGRDCDEGLMVCLEYDVRCILLASDTVRVGASMPVALINLPVGTSYQIAASFGQTPQTLGGCTVCLDIDALFFTSISGAPPFVSYAGIVPPTGNTAGKLDVPNIPSLAGICIYHAAVAYRAAGIQCCTNTAGTLLVP